ncbi:serine hydrolase domain-containing protein [Aestuariibius sp. 2305UL40-4]|uniref:serine hydrolase domain-containing protein n=1 Tax=Aestuariibius violaceus TaxID=3234132 RepID=UPI00345E270E
MSSLQEVVASAVTEGDVPFAVGMLADSGGVLETAAAGEARPGHAADENTVFRIFSMTKAVGSVAAMILIDRGKLTMETEVAEILPDWSALKVLDGWDGDTPRLREPARAATVRHLATHTSGLEYEFWNADVAKYLEVTGHPSILAGTRQSLNYPLTKDPGTGWGYGIGIDWLGLVIEAVDGRKVDAFCREEIFEPLKMTSTAFEPDGMTDRLCDVVMRGEDGGFGPFDLAPPPKPEVYGMGHALYSTPADYMRFLRVVLNRGALDGARILSEGAVDRMLADQMQGQTVQPMQTVAPPVSADVDPFPGTRLTHSFAFMRNEEDIEDRRRAGSQSWAGVCNTHYWIDPASDRAGVIMTQSLPFVEPRFMKTYEAFERAVYAS